MRVKRYIVDTLPDAVSVIRTEMGNDAVILETKEIKVGGFLGMFRKRKLEVMAAVEPNAERTQKKPSDNVNLVVEQILKASQRQKEAEANAVIEQKKELAASAEMVTKQQSEALSIQPTASFDSIYSKNEEHPRARSISATEQFIVDELKNLRLEMHRLSERKKEQMMSTQLQALKQRLIEQELANEWIDSICEDLSEIEIENGQPMSSDEIWQKASDQLLEWLAPYRNNTISSQTRVIQFVGPTGVGKTTTIAKLSADFSMKHGKKLGLITADTYRIAAVEQLRTYANILNIPLEVVFSPMDLTRAFKQLESTELILMDTAGRNFKSDIHVSEVNSLLTTSEVSESVLVLSLTTRSRDMAVIAEKFSKYGVRKVVFTKLDEASTFGSMFNMIMQFGLQPLFVTSGQNVPDDIEDFSIEQYVQILLGEPQHE